MLTPLKFIKLTAHLETKVTTIMVIKAVITKFNVKRWKPGDKNIENIENKLVTKETTKVVQRILLPKIISEIKPNPHQATSYQY